MSDAIPAVAGDNFICYVRLHPVIPVMASDVLSDFADGGVGEENC